MNEQVLSLFPGIGLMDRAFEDAGFTIFRGPDLLWGGDIRRFKPKPGYFNGVIAGSPCQDFSVARSVPPTGEGVEMLKEFGRIVSKVQPEWALLENVPAVPDIKIEKYERVRFPLCAAELGIEQIRFRHFQFFWKKSVTETPIWPHISSKKRNLAGAFTITGSVRMKWEKLKEISGLPADYELPGFTKKARIQAVANGVPFHMGLAVAEAIRDRAKSTKQLSFIEGVGKCECGCGRIPQKRRKSRKTYNQACRKRKQEQRKRKTIKV